MDKISALMDGELDEHEASRLFARLKPQDELRESWDTFHLIGDAMRGDCRLSPHFSAADGRTSGSGAHGARAPRRRDTAKRVNTYVLSAAASLSAVALVVWVAFSINPLSTPPQVVAKARDSRRVPRLPPPPRLPASANVSSPGQPERVSAGAPGVFSEHRDPGRRALYSQRVGHPAGAEPLAASPAYE